ncbi:HVO_0234 family beta-propeller protein [Haladaptatus sp. GCM10025893]|uniref:HVO_0234 family beta-propeller protein n=1 Tax=Haladaptatus sp. GCM10025893 TaxID=3252659 RepID=UPI00361BB395
MGAVSLPVSGQVADAAYDAATYAATVDGTFLADAGEGYRTHPLGLRDVHALCVL